MNYSIAEAGILKSFLSYLPTKCYDSHHHPSLAWHTDFILDELCAQGLMLWLDDNGRWQWRWQGTELKSAQGFWAIGEAVVDAAIGRFPETFSVYDSTNAFE